MSPVVFGFQTLPIASISIPPRFRPLSAEHAEKLAVSFTDYGRTAPIIVRPDAAHPGRYVLVAGMHRIKGAEVAGKVEIDVDVQDLDDRSAERVEIAENLFRYEPNPLDRARSIARLAVLWEHEHGKNAGGRPRKNPRQNGEGFDRIDGKASGKVFAERFSADARKKINMSERTVQRCVALGNALTPDVLDMVRGTYLETHEAHLTQFVRLDPAQQRHARGGISRGMTLPQALGRTQRDPEERIVNAFTTLWMNRAGAGAKRRILKLIGITDPTLVESIVNPRSVKLLQAAE